MQLSTYTMKIISLTVCNHLRILFTLEVLTCALAYVSTNLELAWRNLELGAVAWPALKYHGRAEHISIAVWEAQILE